MADTIVVLNAGSSSLKFSVFLDGDPLRLLYGGQLAQLEGVGTRPTFVARDAAGHVFGEHSWARGPSWGIRGQSTFSSGGRAKGPSANTTLPRRGTASCMAGESSPGRCS